jgi:hypothetical protein
MFDGTVFPSLTNQFQHHPSLHILTVCCYLCWFGMGGQASTCSTISSTIHTLWGPDARFIEVQIRYGSSSTTWTLRRKSGKRSIHSLERCTLSFPRRTSKSLTKAVGLCWDPAPPICNCLPPSPPPLSTSQHIPTNSNTSHHTPVLFRHSPS